MELTLPLVSFLFVCLIFPKIVRNRPQFYIAFGLMVLILLFNIFAQMFSGSRFANFLLILNQILLLAVFILLVLCAGGLSLHELTGEVFRSFEVMRRGDTEKTTIIPLTGQQPKPRTADYEQPPPPRQEINQPAQPTPTTDTSAPIPIEDTERDAP